jgi:PLP dependent protein
VSIKDNLSKIKSELPSGVTLVAVTKTHPVEVILEAYKASHKIFGENKVQEMISKQPILPADVEWHLIGHLQTNKVKFVAPFVKLIHSVDSMKLLKEINKEAKKNNRKIDCLLQIHIAREETKSGLSFEEAENILNSDELKNLSNVRILGLMGMATNTNDQQIIRSEFKSLNIFFERLKIKNPEFKILSTGMSSDYKIAVEEGSTMVRVGSAIFGNR